MNAFVTPPAYSLLMGDECAPCSPVLHPRILGLAMNRSSPLSSAASDLRYSDFPLGAHLVAPRRGYFHHGIYVGRGEVVHYSGLSDSLRRGPIARVTLSQFASGRAVTIANDVCAAYTSIEIAARALSRLGEDNYHLLSNNCEHFCAWCVHGVARSPQVERLLAWPRQMVQVVRSLLLAPLQWT